MAVLVAPVLDAPPLKRYGLPEYVQGASPAANAAFTQALGGAFHVRLVCLFARLVADANVADRQVTLEYRDGEGNRFAVHGSAVAHTAGLTRDYFFSAYQPAVVQLVDDTMLVPLSPILLPPTFDFRLAVDNSQAGDQLSRIRFVWERFIRDE